MTPRAAVTTPAIDRYPLRTSGSCAVTGRSPWATSPIQHPCIFQACASVVDRRRCCSKPPKTERGPNITTSTPAADPAGRNLYLPGVDGFVHELDPAIGKERRGRGFPVRITTMPNTEKDASPLNVAGGYLYAVTSGYFGDAPPYDGHVVAVRRSDGTTHVFNSLCSNVRTLPTPKSCPSNLSGIWARAGAERTEIIPLANRRRA